MATRKQLVIVPGCGLGNRLQAIVSAQLLAEDTDRELFINWVTEHNTCGATFDELFVRRHPALQLLPANTRCYSSVQRHPSVVGEYQTLLLSQAPVRRFGPLKNDRSNCIAVFTCHQFLGYFHDARFASRLRALLATVQPHLLARVTQFEQQHLRGRIVGVHVRRQDWGRQKTLDYYFEMMRRFSGATFLVCSDDERTFVEVKQQFPTAVRHEASSLIRGERAAIEDALVEMLLLSRVSYLIGTPGSSFSSMAQVIGGMPCNFEYALSMGKRDWQLGNLSNFGPLLWRRIMRRLNPPERKLGMS